MNAAGRRAQRGLRAASAAARDARPQARFPGRALQACCRARLRGSPTSSAGGAAERRRSPSRSRSRAPRPPAPPSLPPSLHGVYPEEAARAAAAALLQGEVSARPRGRAEPRAEARPAGGPRPRGQEREPDRGPLRGGAERRRSPAGHAGPAVAVRLTRKGPRAGWGGRGV